MKYTINPRTAAERLAEHLGWPLERRAGAYEVAVPGIPEDIGPLRESNAWALLARLAGLALNDARWHGPGMTVPEVAAAIRFNPRSIATSLSAHEEYTLLRLQKATEEMRG